MKNIILLAALSFLFSGVASAQEKLSTDTSREPQEQNTRQPSITAKPVPTTTAPTPKNKKASDSPVDNKIAVSDPGMPAEKKTSTNRKTVNATPRPNEKKDTNKSGISPR